MAAEEDVDVRERRVHAARERLVRRIGGLRLGLAALLRSFGRLFRRK